MAIESQTTTIEISGGAGGAETITVIALSNPTILTAVAHALENGDVVTLADFAGASRAHLFAFLKGERDITLGWLEKIAGVLEVDPADLLRGRPGSES